MHIMSRGREKLGDLNREWQHAWFPDGFPLKLWIDQQEGPATKTIERLADGLGLNPITVKLWVYQQRICPERYVPFITRFTGFEVAEYQIRPDWFPKDSYRRKLEVD